MSGNPKFAEAFAEKLAALEQKVGSKYSIVYKNFDSYLVNNRLNPCWFATGDVLAYAETPEGRIVFKVCGDFRAELYDAEGKALESYGSRIEN
jgi:hypothetical protein